MHAAGRRAASASACATPASGCAPEQLAQLFQPFNRLGKEAGAEEGTGIGLVVTKRLVELMGGAIGVDSAVGIGSVFWVEFSAAAAPQLVHRRSRHAAARPRGARRRGRCAPLLYVEDNPANLELVEQLIARRAGPAHAERRRRQPRHRVRARLPAAR